jgi:drug/metabolite transporter (DMT)-like permease
VGFAVFGDIPSLWTIVGALLIVASGVYVFSQQRGAGEAETSGT